MTVSDDLAMMSWSELMDRVALMPIRDWVAVFDIYDKIRAFNRHTEALRVAIRQVEADRANRDESGMEEASREYEEAMAAQEAFNGEA